MNLVTSVIGFTSLLCSLVLFGVLIAVGLTSPVVFLVVVGGVVYALYRWAKAADARSKPIVFLDNPYLDRGTPPADIVAKQQGKRTSLD